MSTHQRERLREARMRAGLSQRALSERTGIHHVLIANYERDQNRPGLDHALALARVLDTSVEWLFGDDVTTNARPQGKKMSKSYWGQFRKTTEADLVEARYDPQRFVEMYGDKADLLAVDLIDLFFASKAPLKKAGKLPPHNFRRDLGAMIGGAKNPWKVAEAMVRETTDGFRAVVETGHLDLTVETLVIDDSKPYQDGFDAEYVKVSKERLRAAHTPIA
jgi:transcriptional regulator with XRE-family HTH domain